MNPALSGRAAIAGIGATEFSKNSGRSEMRLALEAITAALDDAGVEAREVDGIAGYTMDNNGEPDVFRAMGGRDLKFFTRVAHGGGGACAPFLHAAMAVATGVASMVLVYRALNERSEYRFGGGAAKQAAGVPDSRLLVAAYHQMHGLRTPAAVLAIVMQRYMHDYGATTEDFGRIAVTLRDYAATNPDAYFHGKPITLAEHQASRMVAAPFRLLDCCQESDGAIAAVITSTERARDLRQVPARILAAAQGATGDQLSGMATYYRPDIASVSESALVARQLYEMAGLSPGDIDAAMFYDHMAPTVLPQLEAFGFCGRGEAKDFVKDGHIGRGGRLPVNTHGGQIGEAYLHGLNGIAEGVRQLRGSAANQVGQVRHVLVGASTGVPTSGMILGRD